MSGDTEGGLAICQLLRMLAKGTISEELFAQCARGVGGFTPKLPVHIDVPLQPKAPEPPAVAARPEPPAAAARPRRRGGVRPVRLEGSPEGGKKNRTPRAAGQAAH